MVLSDVLESFRVGHLPSIFYIPDYLSIDEQNRILHQVNIVSSTKWKFLKNRRLQSWGGVVHEKGLLPQKLPTWLSDLTGTISSDLALFPSQINHVLVNEYLPSQGIMPHQDGPAYFPVVSILSLGAPAVMQFTPHQRLLEKDPDVQPKMVSVILMPGSLLVFKDVAYEDYLHGIDDCHKHYLDETVINMHKVNLHTSAEKSAGIHSHTEHNDLGAFKEGRKKCNGIIDGVVTRSGTRISLTCREVSKVHKKLFRL